MTNLAKFSILLILLATVIGFTTCDDESTPSTDYGAAFVGSWSISTAGYEKFCQTTTGQEKGQLR